MSDGRLLSSSLCTGWRSVQWVIMGHHHAVCPVGLRPWGLDWMTECPMGDGRVSNGSRKKRRQRAENVWSIFRVAGRPSRMAVSTAVRHAPLNRWEINGRTASSHWHPGTSFNARHDVTVTAVYWTGARLLHTRVHDNYRVHVCMITIATAVHSVDGCERAAGCQLGETEFWLNSIRSLHEFFNYTMIVQL